MSINMDLTNQEQLDIGITSETSASDRADISIWSFKKVRVRNYSIVFPNVISEEGTKV